MLTVRKRAALEARFTGISEWLQKYWDILLMAVGTLLTAIGTFGFVTREAWERAKKQIDENIPKDEKLTEEDFQKLVDTLHAQFPNIERKKIEEVLRQILYPRVPAKKKKEIPWVWIAIGVGALWLLSSKRGGAA